MSGINKYDLLNDCVAVLKAVFDKTFYIGDLKLSYNDPHNK